ncbi:MAG: bifunctional diguanylate cyclase/phosphodiesterase [Raoultibacter sp.]
MTMVVSFLVMFAILYALFSTAMSSMLSERETESMRSQTDLERSMLTTSVEHIPNITKEWAGLTYIYDYVTGASDLIYRTHLSPDESYKLNKLNLLTITDLDGNVLFEKHYNYADEVAVENYSDISDLYGQFADVCAGKYSEAVGTDSLATTNMGYAGFASKNGEVYYLSAQPIVDVRGKRPMVGTLIFGRLIDDEELGDIIENENVQLSVLSSADVSFSENEKTALEEDSFVMRHENEALVGYAVLGSSLDEPDILVRDVDNRGIYEQGQNLIVMIMVLVALGCAVLLVVTLNLLNRIAIKPLMGLVDEVRAIDVSKENSSVRDDFKSIELHDLSHAINSLLERTNSDRNLIEEKNKTLYRSAHFDSLTGLRNRLDLEESLVELVKKAEAQKQGILVFFLDIDRLKYINDTYGHQLGDGLIVSIAERLMEACPEEAVIARASGDEFAACILTDESQSAVPDYASSLLSVFEEPFKVNGRVLEVTASLGSSFYPVDGLDSDALMKNAEVAMYHAKSSGKGLYAAYKKDYHESFQRRVYVENQLRRAIHDGCKEFEMYYQPKLRTKSNTITQCEALIRWNAPNGKIYPDEFIATAEECGLIIPLTWWIIDECARQAKILQDFGHQTTVSINIPPQIIMHEEFIDRLTSAATQNGISCELFDVEITERTLLDEPERVAEVFEKLQKLNIEVSVDDFGTGYSSLNYLNKLSIDRLKIDQSFIRMIDDDEDSRTIVRAIIAMASNLGIEVTAEGVEEMSQYEFLRDNDCDEIQGYLIARPAPADEYLKFVESWDAEKPVSK